MKLEIEAQTGAQLRDRIMDLLGPEMVLNMLRLYWRPRGHVVNVEELPSGVHPESRKISPYVHDNLVSGIGAAGEQGWQKPSEHSYYSNNPLIKAGAPRV